MKEPTRNETRVDVLAGWLAASENRIRRFHHQRQLLLLLLLVRQNPIRRWRLVVRGSK